MNLTYSTKKSSQDVQSLSIPKESFTYKLVSYFFVFPLFRFLFKGKTSGNLNVPIQGSLVVVANHGSYLDPPILGHALGRPLAFMAKAELFKIPLLAQIIRACGAYPVSRGAGDREAIRVASEKLRQGWATGVFLDGTRQRNGRVNKPRAGAALLAARTGSPLLPVAIINSHRAFAKKSRFFQITPVHLRIGKLIPPPKSTKKVDLEQTNKVLQEAINAMLDLGLISGNN